MNKSIFSEGRKAYSTIRDVILEMETPFHLTELFAELAKLDITDRDLILNVLDDLRDAGLVAFTLHGDVGWVYSSFKHTRVSSVS